MKALSIYLLIVFSLISCSPQKRLNRLIDKYPELKKVDTIIVRDTIIINNYTFDTVTSIKYHDSTIIVNNEKVFAKYYYDTLRSEIIHEIECKGDTIYYEKAIPVEKVIYKELSWWHSYKHIIYFILFLLIVLFFLKKFKDHIPFM